MVVRFWAARVVVFGARMVALRACIAREVRGAAGPDLGVWRNSGVLIGVIQFQSLLSVGERVGALGCGPYR